MLEIYKRYTINYCKSYSTCNRKLNKQLLLLDQLDSMYFVNPDIEHWIIHPVCGDNDHNWVLWSIQQSCNSYRLCHKKLGKLVFRLRCLYHTQKIHACHIKMTRKIFKSFKLHNELNRMMVNLIFAELISSAYGVPMDITAALQYGWKLGKVLCNATGVILTLSG